MPQLGMGIGMGVDDDGGQWKPSKLTNVYAWYDYRNGITLDQSVKANGVLYWDDIISARRLSQPTGANQPFLDTFLGLTFDGATTNFNGSLTIPTPCTIFMVVRVSGNHNYLMDYNSTGSRNFILLSPVTSSVFEAYRGATLDTSALNGTIAKNNYKLLEAQFTTAAVAQSKLTAYRCAAASADAVSASANTGDNTWTSQKIGSNYTPSSYMAGYIKAIIIMSAIATAAEIAKVKAYCKKYYGADLL